jgi:hypothetical protein
MRNIYKLPSRRTRMNLMRAAAVVAALGVAGLITHGPTSGSPDRQGSISTAAAADRSATAAATTYFPSQYELHAGPPETHVEAF